MAGKATNKRNLVWLLHNAIIYANEVGQPGEQLTETMVGNFPTRGSIYDIQVLWVIMLSGKWKVTHRVFFFSIIPEVIRVFSFMLKVLFPVAIFSTHVWMFLFKMWMKKKILMFFYHFKWYFHCWNCLRNKM